MEKSIDNTIGVIRGCSKRATQLRTLKHSKIALQLAQVSSHIIGKPNPSGLSGHNLILFFSEGLLSPSNCGPIIFVYEHD